MYTASSLACGLAQSPLMLNVSRAVQGIGGAIMLATSLALIADAFRGRDRGTAFAAYGAVIGAAVAVGPLVGGALTSGLGWRWIFFVNVPIGIGGTLLTFRSVSESRDPGATRVDWLGLVTFSGSLFLFVYALIQGNDRGWGSAEILGCLAGGGRADGRLRRRRAAPATADVRPQPAAAPGALQARRSSAFAISASIFSMFLYLTLYIQNVLEFLRLSRRGLRFLPLTVPVLLVAPIARAAHGARSDPR